MLKNLISTVIFGIVLVVLYNELWNTSFVEIDRIHEVREQSVQLAEEGNYDDAIFQLENLLKLAPDDQLLWADYLVVLNQSGQSKQAIKLAKEKDLANIPSYALKELFEGAISLGDVEFAQRLAASEISQSEQPVNVVINRATQLYDAGYSAQAHELLDYSKPISEEDSLNLVVTRIVLLERSDPWQAQQETQKLLFEENVNRIELWEIYKNYWIGQAREGNTAEAIVQLRHVVDRAPTELNLASELLVLLSWNSDFIEAESIFDSISNKKELPAYVREAAALTLYNRGRLTESRDIYVQLLSEETENKEYKKGLAKVYIELKQPYEAIALLQPISASVDNDTLIIIGLAQQQAGRYEQALHSLSTAIHSDTKKDDSAYFAWADSLEKTAQVKSIEYVWPRYAVPLDKAPASVSKRVQNLLAGNASRHASRVVRDKHTFNLQRTRRQAAIARQQGRSTQAITLYKNGLSRVENDREMQLGLALTYIDVGDESRASKLLMQLRDRYPLDREILDASVYHAQKFSQNKYLAGYLKELILLTEGVEQERYISTWLLLVDNNDLYVSRQDKLIALNELSHIANNELATAQLRNLFAEQRCSDARSALSTISENKASSLQLEFAAYVARSCTFAKDSLTLYEEGMRRFPTQSVFVTGSILAFTDMNDYEQAEQRVTQFSAQYEANNEFILAQAYLRFSQEDYAASLLLYEQVLSVNANHHEAYVGWVLSQAELEQADEAIQYAQNKPDLFSNLHWKRLYELRAGQLIRMAEAGSLKSRIPNAHESIVAIDTQLEFLQEHFPEDNISRRNAQLNKVRAYTLADQAPQAVAIYESLDLNLEQVPTWGLVNASEAYLQNQQPEKAITLANHALQENPTDLNILSIIFYAQLDVENYQAADVTRHMMMDIIQGHEITDGRAHWVTRLDALFEAYQNRLNIAEKKLDSLQAKAPEDQQVAMTRATIYRWRGWPNKALETLEAIPENSVDDVSLNAAKANTLIDRQSFNEAEAVISELMDEHFYHRDVENISERWRIHNLRQYTAEVLYGESSGNAFGNEELTFEQRLYSSPINNHFRTYARHRYEFAKFPEGNGYLNRVGVGGEYRSKSFDVTAEANASTRDSSDPGLTVGGVWRLGDHISFSGEAQTFSRLVPLRGNNDDVKGKSITVGARYRWNETHHTRISAGYADFDDGNERKFFFIENQHGLYQSAHHRLSLSQEFYTSENEEIDAFYFNPERDNSIRVAGIYDGVIWRRYTRQWTHRLTVGLGNYNQRGEGSAGIWDLEYLQSWQLDPTLEVKYGYIHRRRTYDGNPESFNAGIASLNWRF